MSQGKEFDPAKRKKLNNPERLKWVPPARVETVLKIEAGASYLDVGAGTGYLSGKIVEDCPQATVHCLDIEPLMVEEMKASIGEGRILPQLMERDILPFEENSMDGAWSIAVFHELGNAAPLLGELRRVLRPGSRLLIVDWEKKQDACEQGPPFAHRASEEEVMAALQGAGFSAMCVVSGFLHHYGVCGVK